MKRMVFPIALAVALAASGPALAQNTLTLDDFDLGKKASPAETTRAPESDMEKCLVDSEGCKSKEFGGAKKFSIDDVINLGIIDREEVKPKPASTSGAATAPSTEPLPSIDMEVLFDYDSDQLRPDQFGRLTELANLLKNDRFAGYKFAFLGHSDAKGAAAYNRELSKRRAETVARFVNQVSGVAPNRFVSTGLGSMQLKTPADPFGPANRRVQLLLIPVN